MIYFTTDEYFHKMLSLGFVPSAQTTDNAKKLLVKVNALLSYLVRKELLPHDYEFRLNSGWRSESYNAKIGGAKNSNHVIGKAIDINGQEIIKLCEKDQSLLVNFELYAESPIDTMGSFGGWTHLQDAIPHSGNRIFRA